MINEQSQFDAVITWVDGNDPKHTRKINLYKKSIASKTIPSSIAETRFINNNELEYCLKSILKYSSWIDQIFIVTDSQVPSFLPAEILKNKKIHIVDHKTIFKGFEEYLPTFNSISIESMLHNIPQLSENYIYLNDDFLILSETTPNDFFFEDKVVLRGKWKKIQTFGPLRIKASQIFNVVFKTLFRINRSMSLLQQIKAALLAGFEKHYLQAPHYPHPQKRSTISQYYTQNIGILRENIKHKFRNLDQHVAIFLSNHLEIHRDNANIIPDDDCLMICFNRDFSWQIENKIKKINQDEHVKFLCIQSLEEATEKQKERLFSALKARGL